MRITNSVKYFYQTVTGSIAFYPSVITLLFAIIAVAMITLDHYAISELFAEKLPFLNVNDPVTARTILSTNIAGMISLTVFSFSMVMVMLNQAASHFSPRLLPGLVSDKKHQIVLGFYMGTIIYSIIVLMNILPNSDQYSTLGLSVAFAIFFSVMSLALFTYFIHTISQSIQVNNILLELYEKTCSELAALSKRNTDEKYEQLPDRSEWQTINSERSGYLQDFDESGLVELAQKENTIIEIILAKGFFALKDFPIARTQKKLSSEACEALLDHLRIYNKELLKNNHVMGFKQITEVAVKAMSPGINDPGTALNAIDYLTALFSLRLKIKGHDNSYDDDNNLRLIKPMISFEALLRNVMASLRQYTKHDVVIVLKLLHMFNYLLLQQQDEKNAIIIENEVIALLNDIKQNIQNPEDLHSILLLCTKQEGLAASATVQSTLERQKTTAGIFNNF